MDIVEVIRETGRARLKLMQEIRKQNYKGKIRVCKLKDANKPPFDERYSEWRKKNQNRKECNKAVDKSALSQICTRPRGHKGLHHVHLGDWCIKTFRNGITGRFLKQAMKEGF